MDQKTQEALAKLGTVVDPGTKPTGDAVMPDKSLDQEAVETTLKEVQKEQAQDPKKFAPALTEVSTEDLAPAKDTTEENKPPNTKEEASQEIAKQLSTEVAPVICQKCGWDLNQGVILPTEEEVREFTRCLLGERGFEKEYEYLGGGLKVTYKEISSTDKDTLTAILKTIEPEGDNRIYLEVISDMRKIQTMAALSKIVTGEDKTDISAEISNISVKISADKKAVDMLKEFEKVVGKYPATLVDILLRGYIEFARLLSVLTEAAFDENFWEGAGLELPPKPTV